MTELATFQPGAGIALPTSQNVVDLQAWASELTAAHQIGMALASTDFVPLSLKTLSGGKLKEHAQVAENVAACILAGKALGLDPMNAIQNIFIVHGRPAMYARTMAALILNAGHELERVKAEDGAVAFRGRRAGADEWQIFEWTYARAQKAGYTTNKKYQTDPIAMLTAKCQSEAARVIAPDVLTGIAYSKEELELEDLGETATVSTIPPAATGKPRPLQRKPRTAGPALPSIALAAPRDAEPVDEAADAAAEADSDQGADQSTGEIPEQQPAEQAPEQAPAPEQDVEPQPCTPEQIKAVQDALKAAGYANRTAAMEKCSNFAGRPIGASKQLTETEAVDLVALLWEEVDAATPAADETADAA